MARSDTPLREPEGLRHASKRVAVGLALVVAATLVARTSLRASGEEVGVEPRPGTPGFQDEARARLLLNRATFGPRPGSLERLEALGISRWLDRELDPKGEDQSIERRLESIGDLDATTAELMARYPRPSAEERRRRAAERERGAQEPDAPGEPRRRRRGRDGPGQVIASMSHAKLLRAVESERQLEEVMVDFWFNHFNVYARKNRNTTLSLLSYERDAIRPHVFGKFEDLLVATASHPAMLFYLDNWTNTKEGFDPRESMRRRIEASLGRDGRRGRRPGALSRTRRREGDGPRRATGLNENYARELLELHTVGVDGGYDQNDVVEVARAFTGWSVVTPELSDRLGQLRERLSSRSARAADALPSLPAPGEFYFNGDAHDNDPKRVLGATIDSGGMQDGLDVLRLLSRHPSTAKFISTKLAQRFVADSPSPELVETLSQTFLKSDGDISAVLRHLFLSDEFVSEGIKAEKIKTPLELVASSARLVDASVEGPAVFRALMTLGMPPYMCQPPTGYEEEAEAWLSAGNVLSRVRFVAELAANRVPGLYVPMPGDIDGWLEQAGHAIAAGPVSGATEDLSALEEAVDGILGETGDTASAERQAIALLLASPGFQRQ